MSHLEGSPSSALPTSTGTQEPESRQAEQVSEVPDSRCDAAVQTEPCSPRDLEEASPTRKKPTPEDEVHMFRVYGTAIIVNCVLGALLSLAWHLLGSGASFVAGIYFFLVLALVVARLWLMFANMGDGRKDEMSYQETFGFAFFWMVAGFFGVLTLFCYFIGEAGSTNSLPAQGGNDTGTQ